MKELYKLTGMANSGDKYNALRDKEIKRSKMYVQRIVESLEENFLNPFGIELDQDDLFNLSSGLRYEGDTEKLLNIQKDGENLYEEFKKKRLYSKSVEFHDKIKRRKPCLFSDTSVPKKKKDAKSQVVEANRNVLAKLLTLSENAKEPIDFGNALEYPLYHVPLSLAYPEGSKRTTQKSKLMEVILKDEINTTAEKEASVLILYMIAHYRVVSNNLPGTFKEWIIRFLKSLLKGYDRVDIVADTYRDFSIKAGERVKRGSSSRLIVKSLECKTLQNVPKFFTNNENKTRLTTLTFNYIKDNPTQCLNILKCGHIVLSGDGYCDTITPTGNEACHSLRRDQEEADTKVILHAANILVSSSENVCIRSPSGDTDIFVIALRLIEDRQRVKFDYGN